jgi:hypothetical protein
VTSLNPGQWFDWLFRKLVDFVTAVATWILQLLPAHSPIPWPDTGIMAVLFRFLGLVGRFVNLPSALIVVGIILTFEAAVLLYAMWRQLLGVFPTFK